MLRIDELQIDELKVILKECLRKKYGVDISDSFENFIRDVVAFRSALLNKRVSCSISLSSLTFVEKAVRFFMIVREFYHSDCLEKRCLEQFVESFREFAKIKNDNVNCFYRLIDFLSKNKQEASPSIRWWGSSLNYLSFGFLCFIHFFAFF